MLLVGSVLVPALCGWAAFQDAPPPAPEPIPFRAATFEDVAPTPPEPGEAEHRVRRFRGELAAPRGSRLGGAPFLAVHGLGAVEEAALAIGKGDARLELSGSTATAGFVRSVLLAPGAALLMAQGEGIASARERDGAVARLFGVAARAGADGDATPRPSVRAASVFPISPQGDRLDVYWIRDAQVASESLPSGEGLSLAGAGDKPRRFMKGQRFEAGEGRIASLRYLDPSGGSLRVSIALPSGADGPVAVPARGASVAVTELAPDLSFGRVAESVHGWIQLDVSAAGLARLRLSLEARLRRVGADDPQTLHLFGDLDCVQLSVEQLTPWLGRHSKSRPILEDFAFPTEHDR